MKIETSSELAIRLSKASVKKLWDVYSYIQWPDALDRSNWALSPELISLAGTEFYEGLSEEQRKVLSFWEVVNFFSFTLQGERPLCQGLVHQMYNRQGRDNTTYLHHFLDEENKHMVMFGVFCNRYAGKIYPEKKLVVPREFEKGEDDVVFFIKALVVEELGDVFNVTMMKDERIDPLVREINLIHHNDEARHIVFGRRVLQEVFSSYSTKWRKETLDALRAWVATYLKASWGDFYNPTMYKDAGLPDPYRVREMALAHPATAEHRKRCSKNLVDYFLEVGILLEEPAL